jgi:hypothetical protein
MLFAEGPGSKIQKPLTAVVIARAYQLNRVEIIHPADLYRVFERKPALAPHPLPEPPSTKELELA